MRKEIMTVLGLIFRMSRNQVVSVSLPYLDDDGWGYVFATDGWFERRLFSDEVEALSHYKATTTGLSLGSPSISFQNLPIDVACQLREQSDYDHYVKVVG